MKLKEKRRKYFFLYKCTSDVPRSEAQFYFFFIYLIPCYLHQSIEALKSSTDQFTWNVCFVMYDQTILQITFHALKL